MPSNGVQDDHDSQEMDAYIVSLAEQAAAGDDSLTPPQRRARRTRERRSKLRDFVHLLVFDIAIPILVVILLKTFIIGVYRIPSGSMMDTIEIGDQVVTNRLAPDIFKLKRGDVVVFKDPDNWLKDSRNYGSDDLIKRLIGLPGDVVACQGHGAPVTVNGVSLDESAYIRPGVAPSDFAFSVRVGRGKVFVMGDNRANSSDSRWHQDDRNGGQVPVADIRGVAMFTMFPFSRIGTMKSHHEVFAAVPEASGA